MITIVISKNEGRLKEALTQILRQEGYNVSDASDNDGAIKIVGSAGTPGEDLLKNKIIELEYSLYKEKRGELYKFILETIEKPLLEHTLERTEGNQLKAAKILGINRNTMRSKIKRLGIDAKRWRVSNGK